LVLVLVDMLADEMAESLDVLLDLASVVCLALNLAG